MHRTDRLIMDTPRAVSVPKTVVGYGAMIAGTVGAFLLIQAYGARLEAPPPASAAGAAAASASADTLMHVLLALIVVILAARTCGAVVKLFHQPPVIGEVIAGIALGPSLLGRVAPGATSFFLPPFVAPYLSIIAQFVVILFMFLIGLELDGRLLRQR